MIETDLSLPQPTPHTAPPRAPFQWLHHPISGRRKWRWSYRTDRSCHVVTGDRFEGGEEALRSRMATGRLT